ncbi:Hypothetical_protein [Hexamita inflata]|uniref:Hypothetical_protein n=1 Tax=Hexamita inflata TaxID=28002 RepID=A0AA86RIN1_9EUKA|nr:Hypothetical protein HINF_LOCUS60485 [Hexamita inflata]CAI9972844.1 Hypothetical protein HINF_LOCUS60489 [Hexamita inflata]
MIVKSALIVYCWIDIEIMTSLAELYIGGNQLFDISAISLVDNQNVLQIRVKQIDYIQCDSGQFYTNYIDDEYLHISEATQLFGVYKVQTSEMRTLSPEMKCFFLQNNIVEEIYKQYYDLKVNFKRTRKTFIKNVNKLNKKVQNIQLYFPSAIVAQFQLCSVCDDQ